MKWWHVVLLIAVVEVIAGFHIATTRSAPQLIQAMECMMGALR